MRQTHFSVAMSVYNKDDATFFNRALQSITDQQTVLPSEIVLVCDGILTDDLNDVIDYYQNRYSIFKIIRFPENKGLGHALKIAIENCSNELIARMDSDDVSVPDRFEQQLQYFEQYPDIDIVGGDITEFIGEESNIVGKRAVPKEDINIKKYMKKRSPFNHVTVMYKKSAVQAAGGYLDWFWNEDYYLWIRMQLNKAVFANTGTVLVNVRVGEEMYQRRGGKQYFISEYKIQKLMFNNQMIDPFTFATNVAIRFVVQLLLPNKVRSWVFQTFARN